MQQHPLQQIRNLNQPPMAAQRGNRYSRDLSDRDLSSAMPYVAGSGAGLLVNFFYTKVHTKNRDATHNGQVQTRLCVSKQPRGDRSTVATRYITREQAMREFPHEFASFEEYGEVMTTGTPLHELPGISVSQMGILAINGIRSIEDLVGLNSEVVSQLGLDATRAYKTAKAWIERRDANTEVIGAADVAARAEVERKTLTEELEKSRAAIKALEMQVSAMQKAQVDRVAAQTAMPSTPGASGSVVSAVETSPESPDSYLMTEDDNPLADGPDMAFGGDDLGGGDDVDPLAD